MRSRSRRRDSRPRDSSRPRESQSRNQTQSRQSAESRSKAYRKGDYSDYSEEPVRTKAKSSAPAASKGRRAASDYSDDYDSRESARRRPREPPKRAEPSNRDSSAPLRRQSAGAGNSHAAPESSNHSRQDESQGQGTRRRFTESGNALRSEETPPGAPKKKPRVRRTQQLRRNLQLAQMIKEAEEAAARGEHMQQEVGNGSYNGDDRATGFSAGKEGTKVAIPAPVLAIEPSPAPPAQPMSTEPSGGRQIAVRGVWAEFATSNNRTYWMNVVTKEKTWLRPAGVQGSQDNQPRTGATVSRDAWTSKNPNMLSGNHGHIFVGGMPHGMNEMIFKQSFERFGKLVSMTLYTDRGYGFCQYATAAEARAAVEVMHKSHFYGTRIMCKLANLDGIR
eukprot:CAMPEP_0169269624 /NCGR_PEP_ID=MMETSP1016-20121227/48573_1 /TAXON_ID=342587 /ORGANISM="Karlodinium micrum, Strain CCMP2283" /LENGTH=391 /DNA_ID=CAMNT_0009354695 /DNA_START=28 /DNA_END=1203 /DNA_ORIENTATION=+